MKLGEDSTNIIDFQLRGKGFTLDISEMKENKTYWVMLFGQSWNFGIKDNKIQFWEPETE